MTAALKEALRTKRGIQNARMTRTLVRVEQVRKDRLVVVVPGWNVRERVLVALEVPKKFRVKGYRFFCKVNMAAERQEDLWFTGPFEPGGKGGRTRLTDKKISSMLRPEKPAPKKAKKRQPFTCEFCDGDLYASEGKLTCLDCDPDGRHNSWPPPGASRPQLFGRAIARAILRDHPESDHTECDHDVGHCVYSTAFALLMRSPLYTTSGAPPSLQKKELQEMRGLLDQIRFATEKLVSAAYGSEPLSSRSPLGSMLSHLQKLNQYTQVGLARLDAGEDS